MVAEGSAPAEVIKLSQNENAYGASPRALKAIETHYPAVFRYPDILHKELVYKLAKKHNLTPEHIIVSAGSVALMDMSIKSFVDFDENIVTAEITFPGYKTMAKINRRTCKFVELVDNTIDLNGILARCDEKTKLVFIANPNNPTGTIVTHSDLKSFLQEVSPAVYVVVDEAYAEYVDDGGYPDSLELLKEFPNLIILRTFSKIYGLAGLRIGYAMGRPNVIGALVQHKTPFSLNSLAAVAASAALDDTEFVEKCAALNAQQRSYLHKEFLRAGFKPTLSQGNFIYVEFNTPGDSERVFDRLKDAGVIVRPLARFGAENALRITIGRPEENEDLVAVLRRM